MLSILGANVENWVACQATTAQTMSLLESGPLNRSYRSLSWVVVRKGLREHPGHGVHIFVRFENARILYVVPIEVILNLITVVIEMARSPSEDWIDNVMISVAVWEKSSLIQSCLVHRRNITWRDRERFAPFLLILMHCWSGIDSLSGA